MSSYASTIVMCRPRIKPSTRTKSRMRIMGSTRITQELDKVNFIIFIVDSGSNLALGITM